MKRMPRPLVIVLLGLLARATTSAQTGSPTPVASPLPSPAATSSPTPMPPGPPPEVIAAEGHLELDDIIKVEVDHFTEWAAKNDPTKLVPFICPNSESANQIQ